MAPDGRRRITARECGYVLRRTGAHLMGTRLPLMAAGVAFFAVLSIAPVMVTALSIYAAVNTPEQALQQLSEVAETLPPDLEQVVADQLTTFTTASTRILTTRVLVGLVLALGTATTAMTYLLDALSVAYHEAETRSFLRRTGLSVTLVLGGAVLLGTVIAVGGVLTRAARGAPEVVGDLVPVVAWVLLGGLMTFVLAVLYRFGPDRRSARWQWISWGAAGATLLWLATSALLFAYAQRLGTYEVTYGSLAGVALSMFWLWLTVLLVLLGAVVNAEVERQTLRDSTVGPPRPVGERGAVVADSVPPYPGERPAS